MERSGEKYIFFLTVYIFRSRGGLFYAVTKCYFGIQSFPGINGPRFCNIVPFIDLITAALFRPRRRGG